MENYAENLFLRGNNLPHSSQFTCFTFKRTLFNNLYVSVVFNVVTISFKTAVVLSVTLSNRDVRFPTLLSLIGVISCGTYKLTISRMLVYEPNIKAKTPKIKRNIFFIITQLQGPNPTSQYVTISMNNGIISPKREKHSAPIRAMKGPIVGTATASKTVRKQILKLVLIILFYSQVLVIMNNTILLL